MIIHGDCIEELRKLPDNSVDAVITDPPYGLSNTDPSHVAETITQWVQGNREYLPPVKGGGFMGKAWDSFVPPVAVWDECLRVLKPGGHLLSFAGSRTMDLMTLGIRLAGFDIRDSIAWLYGSGFPKSQNVALAIDKQAGARGHQSKQFVVAGDYNGRDLKSPERENYEPPTYITPEAQQWEGWGTALKPAFEPIVVARKPFPRTVAANVLQYGTGALNIDASRIATDDKLGGGANVGMTTDTRNEGWGRPWMDDDDARNAAAARSRDNAARSESLGRFPANVILDESQASALDEQSGITKSTVDVNLRTEGTSTWFTGEEHKRVSRGDSGGASRFFFVAEDEPKFKYCAKAGKAERPGYWWKSCNCETVKPCNRDGSQNRDIDDSVSVDGTFSSTSISGSKPTEGKSPQGTTSTTRTKTDQTTASKTSNSSPNLNTSDCIPGANSEKANGGSPAESVKNSSQSQSNTGTSAPKDGPNTDAADPATSLGWSATSVCANCGAPAKLEQHSTVKPLTLMRYLVKLVTPPGGTVLEPFAGSGTTVEACILEGFECIAIEREADYLPLIEARMNRAVESLELL